MHSKFYIPLLALFACLALVTCQWSLDHGQRGRVATDVKVHRYDKLLDEYISLNSFSALQKMSTDYPQETKFLRRVKYTRGTTQIAANMLPLQTPTSPIF